MLIKKLLIPVLLLSLFCFSANSLSETELSARSAVVIEADSNTVLFQKNMSERLSMASTTKIMTAILAIESGKLGCTVTAERDIICEGTSISIEKGDCFTLETLVWAILLESGNDAAILIAEYLSGSEAAFAEAMNNKADSIGLSDTNFVTSSGLDADEHYTTAYDMALLASYAVKNPVFRKICSSETYVATYISPEISETYTNHNKLLRMYDGVFGVKTGFTKKSGRCLVSACEKEGKTLVAVTLKAPDDWNDHIKLYDYCFNKISSMHIDIQLPSKIKVYGSKQQYIEISADSLKESSYFPEYITYVVVLPEFLYAPVCKHDTIGKIIVFVNGKKYKELPITARTDALPVEGRSRPEYSFFDKLINIFM